MAIFLLGKISIIKILIVMTSPIILHHANLSSPLRIIFTPFSLTSKNHVPHEIVERLQPAGYLCLVADFTKSPNDNIYDEDGEERGTKRKKAPAVPS